MIVAIAAGNENQDGPDTPYADAQAPAGGLDGCAKGDGTTPRTRRAVVAFACSLNRPIEWRAANLGQARIKHLIEGFGFVMPPAASESEATPPSTAAVRGLISGSPRRVHHMAGVILGSLIGEGHRPVRAPTLIKALEHSGSTSSEPTNAGAITPNRLIRPHARGFLKTVLQAPFCHRHQGAAHGTLKSLSHWCATERGSLKLHFAKTGTDTNDDPNQTIDAWVAGGLQFANGQAYSYVVVVGTGSTKEPFGRSLHSAQVAAPLLEVLLNDLEARNKPRTAAATSAPVAPQAAKTGPRKATKPAMPAIPQPAGG